MSRTYRGRQEKTTKKIFFNKHLFDEIKKIINTDPLKAKTEFEEYMMQYPLDYSAQTLYVSVLIRLQQFELAEKVLDEVEFRMKKDGKFQLYEKKKNLDETSVVFCRSALLCHQQKYSELYEYLLKLKFDLKKLKIETLLVYLKKKLGLLNMEKEKAPCYLVGQIIDYSEDEMKEHIKSHFACFNDTTEEINESLFTNDFPFEKVLEEIKKNIPSKIKICNGLYDDTYIFKFDNCGKHRYKPVHYFKVICFENSNQIITIYPSPNCENLPCIDLNYIKQQEETQKIKTISQRDKFLRRYKK